MPSDVDPKFRKAFEHIADRRAWAHNQLVLAEAARAEDAGKDMISGSTRLWYGVERGLTQAMDVMLEVEPALYGAVGLPDSEPFPAPPEELAARLDAAAEASVTELVDVLVPVPSEPTFYDNVKSVLGRVGVEMPVPPTDDQIWGMALMKDRMPK